MLDFLRDNIGTIIIGLTVLAIVMMIVFKMAKDKRQGKSFCGYGCEHCQNSACCHGSAKNKNLS